MSNLDNITQKIIGDAKANADKILEEAKQASQKLINEKTEEAKQQAQEEIQKAREVALRIKDRVRTKIQREIRDEVLMEKQKRMNEVFEKAIQQLKNLESSLYVEKIKDALERHPDTEVLELPIGANLDSSVKISVEHDKDLLSGFRLIHGGIRENYDYVTILSSIREELEPEVLDLLMKE